MNPLHRPTRAFPLAGRSFGTMRASEPRIRHSPLNPPIFVEASISQYPDLQLYIGGAWRKSAESLPVLHPANEREIGRVPIASRADLDAALAAAADGFKVWSATAPAR